MQIVIIGGGFAGVNLAQELANQKGFEVTLVDKNNYNFFPPLIYQVATGYLEPSSISYPFRKFFAGKKNLHFRLGELQRVLPSENKIILNNGELQYDHLVFATGAETSYFGMENVKKNAIPMKTLNDAIEMRNTLLKNLEKAAICNDIRERRKLLTIVVVGGGPTGVEVSGMFAEMRKNILLKEYPELATAASQIYLVDGGDALLSPMSSASQKYTLEAVTQLGVVVRLNARVVNYENDIVYFADGETIQTKNLIWAAGVTAKVFEGIPAESFGRGKRMITDAFNKITLTENIYSIGDTCIQITDLNFPEGHPQVAQVAIQQGVNLADNFKSMRNNKLLKPFKYNDKGSMAIIGKNKAVVDLPRPKLHFNGFFAWLIWLFVHLMSLISYRNRIQTFYNWMIAYFSKDQSLRMIIRPEKRSKRDA
ncbi:NAD(P)/FAD-dependent oxidoreductase [Flavobacterium franklandianum]|uniref:NADH:ubiquinone reductase (non-electrogenic) n=1 Tax=Flavobacterium franklandianum TaxID=2594430 RepID=A0A553C897_9FLAO|nr:NAD(P)/FAD-dependent oxidoreductase [Flavobacterium franklandianum]TRX16740.1 NAD(P)/FAD-dependent oxidoreductase [Flavobacterium franklandianum]TRX29652.1 NAD(P)/FAD-dependent oxidoreductase [Flavobacterium franklandianum]